MAGPSARAFANPIAVVVLGAGIATGAGLHSVPIAAVGVVTYLALVVWDWRWFVSAFLLVTGFAPMFWRSLV